jgi:hypothetical protein
VLYQRNLRENDEENRGIMKKLVVDKTINLLIGSSKEGDVWRVQAGKVTLA